MDHEILIELCFPLVVSADTEEEAMKILENKNPTEILEDALLQSLELPSDDTLLH